MITDNLTDDADIKREVRNLLWELTYFDVNFTNILWLWNVFLFKTYSVKLTDVFYKV